MADFKLGDQILISDDYGTDQPAVVDAVGDDGRVYATSTLPIPGDSRHVTWTIPADQVGEMVKGADTRG